MKKKKILNVLKGRRKKTRFFRGMSDKGFKRGGGSKYTGSVPYKVVFFTALPNEQNMMIFLKYEYSYSCLYWGGSFSIISVSIVFLMFMISDRKFVRKKNQIIKIIFVYSFFKQNALRENKSNSFKDFLMI